MIHFRAFNTLSSLSPLCHDSASHWSERCFPNSQTCFHELSNLHYLISTEWSCYKTLLCFFFLYHCSFTSPMNHTSLQCLHHFTCSCSCGITSLYTFLFFRSIQGLYVSSYCRALLLGETAIGSAFHYSYMTPIQASLTAAILLFVLGRLQILVFTLDPSISSCLIFVL